jgi:hypothetical protein
MAMQPDDQRDVITSGPEPLYPANGEGNFGWDATYVYPSEGLYASVTQRLSVGDQNVDAFWYDNVTYRTVAVPADNHSTALTGYSNYPAYEPNYAGDGDTGIETFAIMPNIVGLTVSAANAILGPLGFLNTVSIVNTTRDGATTVNDGTIQDQATPAGAKVSVEVNIQVQTYNAPEVPNVVGLTEAAATYDLNNAGLLLGTVTTADNAAGATAINDGLVKTQSVAAGTTVNTGSSVNLVKYAYVGVSTTGPISGFNRTPTLPGWTLTGDQSIMYLVGHTVKPAVGDTISVTGSDNASHNVSWTVELVANENAYNTGGTAVKVTLVDGFIDSNTAHGGIWTKI